MQGVTQGTVSFEGQNNKWNTAEDAAHVVKAIEEADEVRCLKLEGNTLGVDAAKVIGDALAKHPEFERALWKDAFTGRLKDEIPRALKHLFSGLIRAKAHLLELDLSDNALGPVGVMGMTDFMKSPVCYSLEELRLNNNGLGIKGGTMLAESLSELVSNSKDNGTPLKLKVFIAGRNRLEKDGARVYAKLFSSIGTLEEIQMPQNGIFHEGIAALAKAFGENSNIRHINLNDNTFTEVGAIAMAKHLPSMQSLEIINFGDCLLRTKGAFHIANAIEDSHCELKELHLDSNEIKIEGGLAIVDAIGRNKPHFQNLMLDGNQFGEDRRDEIVDRLSNLGLTYVLGPLEDDEEPDSDDEDDDDGYENVSDENYTTEEEENYIGGNDPDDKESVDEERITPSQFFAQPSGDRLLGMDFPQLELVEEVFKTANAIRNQEIEGGSSSSETVINEFFKAFMLVGQFADTNDSKLLERVHACTSALANAAFNCAQKQNLTSLATNSLLMHLGLIKCENKKFVLDWNLKGCLLAMSHNASQSYFPKDTKDVLQLFLSKYNKHVDAHLDEKHKLLAALYKM